jgi:uncharacterized glyoxalase superfamily protein PhnB
MSLPSVYPVLRYKDVTAAIEFLTTAFGLGEYQLHDRAVAAGAEITMPLVDQHYGSREFAAKDPEGNQWFFGTYRPAPTSD